MIWRTRSSIRLTYGLEGAVGPPLHTVFLVSVEPSRLLRSESTRQAFIPLCASHYFGANRSRPLRSFSRLCCFPRQTPLPPPSSPPLALALALAPPTPPLLRRHCCCCTRRLQSDGVEDTVEKRLFHALNTTKLVETITTGDNYSRCGRTDKGVSALGNVSSVARATEGRPGAVAVAVAVACCLVAGCLFRCWGCCCCAGSLHRGRCRWHRQLQDPT